MPDQPRLATTDFYQFGTSSNFGRFSVSTDVFLIDHSNEQVYIPDDGSFEFKGPSRAYGYEAKASVAITRHLSLNGGLTKIANAFFKGGDHRVYVDSAPHFVANAALTMAAWHGWSGSLRMRAINHYRLDGEDPSIVASGHTVFDLGLARQLRRGVELNLSFDNLTNRDYYETQNYFESRVTPLAPVVARIHATPALSADGGCRGDVPVARQVMRGRDNEGFTAKCTFLTDISARQPARRCTAGRRRSGMWRWHGSRSRCIRGWCRCWRCSPPSPSSS